MVVDSPLGYETLDFASQNGRLFCFPRSISNDWHLHSGLCASCSLGSFALWFTDPERSWSIVETLNEFSILIVAHLNWNKVINCIFMFGKEKCSHPRAHTAIVFNLSPEALLMRPNDYPLDIKSFLCAGEMSKCTTRKVKTTTERRETYVAMRQQTSQPPEASKAIVRRSRKYASKDQFFF